MTNGEGRLILKKCYIGKIKYFLGRKVEALITSLVKGIPNEDTKEHEG